MMKTKLIKMAGSRNEKGQAMVEFALVIPILLLAVMAIIEFSWYFTTKYNMDQYSRELGYNLRQPDQLSWDNPNHPDFWSKSGKPPWMTEAEAQLWNYDDFMGWYEIGTIQFVNGYTLVGGYEDANHQMTPFTRYYIATRDDYFLTRLRDINVNLNMDKVKFTLTGGWFINAGAKDIPMSRADAWEGTRTMARTLLYHVDVNVKVEYEYKPLTMVGTIFLCEPGETTIDMVSEKHYRYPLAGYSSN